MLNDIYDWAWVAWILLFFVIEIPAIAHEKRHGSGATLTAHVRRWFSARDKSKGWRLRRLMLAVLLLWLPLHFYAGW
jgi:hypothetical protein